MDELNFSKGDIVNQEEEQTSNLNESNHVLDENLDTVSKRNEDEIDPLKENSFINNSQEKNTNFQNLIQKNENFKEILLILDNKKKFVPKNNTTNFSLERNKMLLPRNLLNLNKEKSKINPNTLKGKISIVYGEITNMAKTKKISKSLGPYPKNQIRTSRNIGFLQDKKKINNQINGLTTSKKNNDPFYNKNCRSFNVSKNKTLMQKKLGIGIENWIGRERNFQNNNFFQEKKTEINNLISYVNNYSSSYKDFFNLKKCSILSKKNITYDSYTNDFYTNELNKFSTRLNSSCSKISNLKENSIQKQINPISPFYVTRRINLQKKVKSKTLIL